MNDTDLDLTPEEAQALQAAHGSMQSHYSGYVSVTAQLVNRTSKAIALDCCGTFNWIPLSKCRELTERQDGLCKVLIPRWLFAKLPSRDSFYRSGQAVIL